MSRLTFITLLSLIVLAIASVVHWQDELLLEEPVSQQPAEDETDFFMLNATTTQFNAQGNVDHRLTAQQVTHYPNGDFTAATRPNITVIHQNNTPWNITAKHGRISQNNNIIELWDKVKLVRKTPANELKIDTSKLTFNATEKVAHTKKAVVIVDNATHVNATGMTAYLRENRTKLLSNVRVTHDPANIN